MEREAYSRYKKGIDVHAENPCTFEVGFLVPTPRFTPCAELAFEKYMKECERNLDGARKALEKRLKRCDES